MQGWFALSYDFLPLSNILPVFVGTHFTAEAQNFLKHFIARFPHYFKDKECGCRDVFTFNFLQKMGIKSYFSKCLTLTLPKESLQTLKIKFSFICDFNQREFPKLSKDYRCVVCAELLNILLIWNF